MNFFFSPALKKNNNEVYDTVTHCFQTPKHVSYDKTHIEEPEAVTSPPMYAIVDGILGCVVWCRSLLLSCEGFYPI